jgi:hypothetical protein
MSDTTTISALALKWIAVGSFPLHDGGGAFETVDEIIDFAEYVLEHADELHSENFEASGYYIVGKRSTALHGGKFEREREASLLGTPKATA